MHFQTFRLHTYDLMLVGLMHSSTDPLPATLYCVKFTWSEREAECISQSVFDYNQQFV